VGSHIFNIFQYLVHNSGVCQEPNTSIYFQYLLGSSATVQYHTCREAKPSFYRSLLENEIENPYMYPAPGAGRFAFGLACGGHRQGPSVDGTAPKRLVTLNATRVGNGLSTHETCTMYHVPLYLGTRVAATGWFVVLGTWGIHTNTIGNRYSIIEGVPRGFPLDYPPGFFHIIRILHVQPG
jgi:hypothetical protein